MTSSHLLACHECDLLQREIPLPEGGVARCRRCGYVLYRRNRGGIDHALAFHLAAALAFVVANLFPVVALDVQGQRSAATLWGAARALHDQGMTTVAALVFLTTMLAPALELAALIYLLLPVHLGRIPRGFAAVFRLVRTMEPWGMVEVFVLGVLVSLVKLAHLANVVPGIALWAFFALMVLLAAGAAAFDPHDLWDRVETVRARRAAGDAAVTASEAAS